MEGYDSDAMEGALLAVAEGMTIRKAAEAYGVTKSTLGDRVSGKVDRTAKPGPPPYLTRPEEEELASFLTRCVDDIGFPKPEIKCWDLSRK